MFSVLLLLLLLFIFFFTFFSFFFFSSFVMVMVVYGTAASSFSFDLDFSFLFFRSLSSEKLTVLIPALWCTRYLITSFLFSVRDRGTEAFLFFNFCSSFFLSPLSFSSSYFSFLA